MSISLTLKKDKIKPINQALQIPKHKKNLTRISQTEKSEIAQKLKVSTAAGVEERLIKLLCSSVLPLSVAESTLLTNFQPSKDYIFSHADEMGVRMARKLNKK